MKVLIMQTRSSPRRRMFVAIDLPAPLTRRLADVVPAARGVKRVQPATMHLTIHFLGDVPEALLPALTAALDHVKAAPFTLELASRGRFPARGPARVLWMGVADSPALAEVHAAVGRGIESVGLPPERRPFTPHVTLARLTDAACRRISEGFLTGAHIRNAAFPVDRFTLYESERTPDGAVHTPVHEVRLGA